MTFPEDGAMDGVSDHEKGTAITDHWYEPRGAWWTVCKICGLAEAAHLSTLSTHAEGGAHAHSDAT
jgi:hypothetical protein